MFQNYEYVSYRIVDPILYSKLLVVEVWFEIQRTNIDTGISNWILHDCSLVEGYRQYVHEYCFFFVLQLTIYKTLESSRCGIFESGNFLYQSKRDWSTPLLCSLLLCYTHSSKKIVPPSVYIQSHRFQMQTMTWCSNSFYISHAKHQ